MDDRSSSLMGSKKIITSPIIISSAVSASHSIVALDAAARGGDDFEGDGEVNHARRRDC